jgi:UDP-GlcNAc:undecaprenyl-phosphate GlcNAc-1-phosphate transferase
MALRLSAVDKRNHRKIHNKLIAQLGGAAVYVGLLGGLAIVGVLVPEFFKSNISQLGGFIICATLMLMLGVYDDFQSTGALTKFTVQIIIACLLVQVGFRLENIFIPGLGDINFGILSIPVTILWLVGITNAFNLIDGLDGLATGLAAIIFLFFCLHGFLFKENFIVYVSLSLMGASIAFLMYNFYPAKIFLGDTGSLFLGFAIGALALYRGNAGGSNNLFFFPAVVIIFLPILDTAFAIMRRIMRRQYIFRGDNCHIHHYYIKQGYSQIQVVTGFYIVTFCFGIISLLTVCCYFFKIQGGRILF